MSGTMSLPKIGDRIDERYELCRLIGEADSCLLFDAVHRFTGRRVVLKVLRGDDLSEADAEARLIRDAFALGKVQHPYLVDVLDAGLGQGRPYVVTALVEGRSLEGLLVTRARIEPAEVATLGRQVALALDALHVNGLLHGDVSPGNVWLVRSRLGGEHIVLRNLEVAYEQRTATGAHSGRRRSGTLEYRSPESATGRVLDPRSDIFSLGVLLFEALTGSLPAAATLSRADVPPDLRTARPDVPEPLAVAIERCLRLAHDERFASARDLAAALEATGIAHRPMNFLAGVSQQGLRAVTPRLPEPSTARSAANDATATAPAPAPAPTPAPPPVVFAAPPAAPASPLRAPTPAPVSPGSAAVVAAVASVFATPPSAAAAAAAEASMYARRKVPRAAYATPVRLLGNHGVMEGRIEDISTRGVLVVAPKALDTGAAVQLSFALPTTGAMVQTAAVIRWVRVAPASQRAAMGFEFQVPPTALRVSVDEYILQHEGHGEASGGGP